MLVGVVVGLIAGGIGLARSFPGRHAPEPPNNRWKLPVMTFMAALCGVLAFTGPWPIVWALLAAICLVEVRFVLAGRNPWWMQSPLDR